MEVLAGLYEELLNLLQGGCRPAKRFVILHNPPQRGFILGITIREVPCDGTEQILRVPHCEVVSEKQYDEPNLRCPSYNRAIE